MKPGTEGEAAPTLLRSHAQGQLPQHGRVVCGSGRHVSTIPKAAMLVDGLFDNMAFLRTENQLRLGHSHLVVGFFGCVWRHPLSGFLDPASFVSW